MRGRARVALLFRHWSWDPFLVPVALLVLVHATGLRRRAAARARAARAGAAGRPGARWPLRAGAFYLGLAVLVVAVDSPLDYWADTYLFAHMLQHILLSFAAPPLIVIGAPWLDLQRGLPRRLQLGFGHLVQRGRRNRLVSGAGRVVTHPLTAVIGFNASMVFWHFPGPFDLAERNQVVHIYAEHASFFVFGLLLWLQILDSPPFHPAWPPLRRVAITFATNTVMVGIAMTLVLFSHDLYPVYAHVARSLFGQNADQQVAGSALWVCGEFSLAPAIYYNLSRWMQGQTGRRPTASPWRRGADRWRPTAPEAGEGVSRSASPG